jgi:hypothetical protein
MAWVAAVFAFAAREVSVYSASSLVPAGTGYEDGKTLSAVHAVAAVLDDTGAPGDTAVEDMGDTTAGREVAGGNAEGGSKDCRPEESHNCTHSASCWVS